MTPRIYLIAFAAVLVSAGLLGAAGLGSLRSVGLLQASIGVSVVAALAGIGAIFAARRSRRG